MSVIKRKRGQSRVQFINTARKLVIDTLKLVKEYPKAYTFTLVNPTVQEVLDVHKAVKLANSRIPKNLNEYQIRRNHLIFAIGLLEDITSKIEIAHEVFGLNPERMKPVASDISEEIKLLNGLIESDEKRFETLPF